MITVFGSINADLVFPVAALPAAGQTVLATGMLAQPGGKGANAAVAAARDGATVVMVGAVGNDALAGTALAGLREAGVDLGLLQVVDGATGCAAICTDAQGRNQIVVASGANLLAAADAIPLDADSLVLTQMEADPAQTAALIGRASRAGARTIHNHAPAAPLDRTVLAQLTILVVNEDEAAWLADRFGLGGSGAAALAAALGPTVIRTLGGAGVEWAGPAGHGQLPAAPVHVVDTTAAGDCFCGVLAAALDRGDALPAAIARANLAAGLACETPGSQRSLPTRAAINARSPA